MLLSVATANYYALPFEQTLEIIARSGFRYIELDLFWERKQWAVAQHLRGYAPREVVRLINQAGLDVASIHDAGGVLEEPDSVRGLINPQLADYLDQLGYAPGCLVFHTPHIEGEFDETWWRAISEQVREAFNPFRCAGRSITMENMPLFDGYCVPLVTPRQLLEFTCSAGLGITLDTTHYAQIGVDIVQAAQVLLGKVRTIHLGDYLAGRTHVFVGDGALDFPAFFGALDLAHCAFHHPGVLSRLRR